MLTRKRDEVIKIGDEISVKAMRIREGRVSLGISAPRNLKVDREETYLKEKWAKGEENGV